MELARDKQSPRNALGTLAGSFRRVFVTLGAQRVLLPKREALIKANNFLDSFIDEIRDH